MWLLCEMSGCTEGTWLLKCRSGIIALIIHIRSERAIGDWLYCTYSVKSVCTRFLQRCPFIVDSWFSFKEEHVARRPAFGNIWEVRAAARDNGWNYPQIIINVRSWFADCQKDTALHLVCKIATFNIICNYMHEQGEGAGDHIAGDQSASCL